MTDDSMLEYQNDAIEALSIASFFLHQMVYTYYGKR